MSRVNSMDLALRARAEAVIPGGMYGHQSVALMPEGYPQFFARAEGAHLWDVDGNRYLDFMCGYGPNLFGYGHAASDGAYIDLLYRVLLGRPADGAGRDAYLAQLRAGTATRETIARAIVQSGEFADRYAGR